MIIKWYQDTIFKFKEHQSLSPKILGSIMDAQQTNQGSNMYPFSLILLYSNSYSLIPL